MNRSSVNVFVSGTRAGTIARSELEDDTFLFSYAGNCPETHAVSLTMPVVSDQYDSMNTIHPVELDGSKAFPSRAQLIRFGRQACGLPSKKVQEIMEKVASGIGRAIEDLKDFSKRNKSSRNFADRLAGIFSEGRESIVG